MAPYLLESCQTIRQIAGTLTHDGILVPLSEFARRQGDEVRYHPYLIVRNDAIQYPICVYHFANQTYTALYMQCSHLGAELQVSGERLTCPAHGSEFDNKGQVQQGPADEALRSFPVSISGEELFIDLRKKS